MGLWLTGTDQDGRVQAFILSAGDDEDETAPEEVKHQLR